MNKRDSFNKESSKEIQNVLKAISPEFKELSVDFEEIAKFADDPLVISSLLFRLTKEREQTNRLLEQIYDKYDHILFTLKQQSSNESAVIPTTTFEILPDQDQKILDLVETKGMAGAGDVMEALGYRGLNAASQRLNKLFREGHLKKVRSGKKILYMAKS